MAVLVATLTPSHSSQAEQQIFCTICAPRGIADALLNIILFAPLGLALALIGAPLRRAVLIGAVLSFGIEVAQIVIPGRDPSAGDVIMNTLGAALGAYLPLHSARWLRPSGDEATWLSLAAASFAALTIVATGFLLESDYTKDDYYGFWTPQLGHIEWYRGRVLDARIGNVPLTHGKLSESSRIRDLLSSGAPLEVKAIAGPPVPALGGLVAIGDGHYRFNLLVGPDRNDLVFEHRTRSEAFGLDQPDIRIRGAMASISPGDTIFFRLWKNDRLFCIQLNALQQCNLGYGAGSGWRILYSGDDLAAGIRGLVSFGWIAFLVAPFSYWARTRWLSATGAAILIAAFLFAVPWSGLVPLTAIDWLAAVAGSAGGWGLRRGVESLGN